MVVKKRGRGLLFASPLAEDPFALTRLENNSIDRSVPVQRRLVKSSPSRLAHVAEGPY